MIPGVLFLFAIKRVVYYHSELSAQYTTRQEILI